MNEPRACDRSAGSLISSGPSSLGALINLARERRQMLAGVRAGPPQQLADGRVRRWLLKNLPRHAERAGDDSLLMYERSNGSAHL
jgi:hypothetical protein